MTEFAPGTLLAGRLKVMRPLGEGGVGAVYEIEHQVTRHRRALKILHPRFRQMPEVVERFLREGSAAGRIGNPHIVETFDAGELDNGAPWLLMELLAGEPLSEVLRRTGRLEFGPACAMVAEVAVAVQAAHDAGIVHRDLKPDNLYVVERDGRPFVKVLDFGMSKFDSGVTGAVSMTAEGTTLGTPLYMAPEQMRGAKDVDGRADIYALGVILYEALAGGVPYNAASFAELAVLVLGGTCARLDALRPDAPAGLSDVVHRAMAIDPAQRTPTARDFAEGLRTYAMIPAGNPAWWRPDDTAGLDHTAQRKTPMGPDGTLPSTPSPIALTAQPGPVAATGSRPHVGSAPPVMPGSALPVVGQLASDLRPPPHFGTLPLGGPPVPTDVTGSGFRRAPSLTRRLRRLGVLAVLAVVGGLYHQLGPKLASHDSMAGGDEVTGVPTFGRRQDMAAPVSPPVPPEAPTEQGKHPARVPAKVPPIPPKPHVVAKETGPCCDPTPQELEAAADAVELKIRGPQLSAAALLVSDETKAALNLTDEQRAVVQDLFAASKRTVHARLLALNKTAGAQGTESESNAQLFENLRDAKDSKFRDSVIRLSKERAGQLSKERGPADPLVLGALDFVLEEDAKTIAELQKKVGADAARAILKQAPSRVFRPPDPAVRSAILAEVHKHPEPKTCARTHLGKHRSMPNAEVKLEWLVHPDGSVTDVGVVSDTVENPAYTQCLVEAVKTWSFPTLAGPKSISVQFPFKLQAK